MTGKIKVEDLRIGEIVETTFFTNEVKESEYRFRATHLNGRRAPKVVLSSDPHIVPGRPCQA